MDSNQIPKLASTSTANSVNSHPLLLPCSEVKTLLEEMPCHLRGHVFKDAQEQECRCGVGLEEGGRLLLWKSTKHHELGALRVPQ
jgi:hypothetical protein